MRLSLSNLHSDVTINIVDVGAMNVGVGDHYNGIKNANVIGFEPSAEECNKLDTNCLPFFIGDGRRSEFKTCNCNMTSSFYEPNTALLSMFNNLLELTTVVNRSQQSTRCLDDIEAVIGADFLKVDAQGSEVSIFHGAERVLKNITVVQTEVCFIPLYDEMPLFAEIDQCLRHRGFLFHKFKTDNILGRSFKPMTLTDKPNSPISQQMWTDAIYVKDFTKLSLLNEQQLLKMAIILNDAYGSIDLANVILEAYDQRVGTQLAGDYRKQLRKEDTDGN